MICLVVVSLTKTKKSLKEEHDLFLVHKNKIDCIKLKLT